MFEIQLCDKCGEWNVGVCSKPCRDGDGPGKQRVSRTCLNTTLAYNSYRKSIYEAGWRRLPEMKTR